LIRQTDGGLIFPKNVAPLRNSIWHAAKHRV